MRSYTQKPGYNELVTTSFPTRKKKAKMNIRYAVIARLTF